MTAKVKFAASQDAESRSRGPLRQTASIFHKPVTLYRNSSEEEERRTAAPKPPPPPSDAVSWWQKPRQLFWEKHLSGLKPTLPDEVRESDEDDEQEEEEDVPLPEMIRPLGPGVNGNAAVASISASLHLNGGNGAIRGQEKAAERNPGAFVSPRQPLIRAAKVTKLDVERQEARVTRTRKKLAEAMAAMP